MKRRMIALLQRRAWIERRLLDLRGRSGASPYTLLRLQGLRLSIERRLRAMSGDRAFAASN